MRRIPILHALPTLLVFAAACASVRASAGAPPGKFGRAMDPSAPLSVPANPGYCAPPLTVECWASLRGKQGFNILVANEPKTSATHWELYTSAGSGDLSFYMPGFAPADVRSRRDVTDGRWHYLAATWDGRTVRLYVDGNLEEEAGVLPVAGMARVSGPLTVGHIPGAGLGCEGLVDEVRVSRCIRSISGAPTGPFTPDAETLGLWHFDTPLAAVGSSALADPERAGAEAARKARLALGSQKASLVLVADNLEGKPEAKRRLLAGVGWFLDAAFVYGCEGFGPITTDSAEGTVGVLAFGEDVRVTAATAAIGGGHEAAGRALGAALKAPNPPAPLPHRGPNPPAPLPHRGRGESPMGGRGPLTRSEPAKPDGGGRLILILGDCHVPADDALVAGLREVVGDAVPIIGGSAPLQGSVYEAGQVRSGICTALLIEGPFTCGLSTRSGNGQEAILTSAAGAAGAASGAGTGDVLLVLAFDCVSRKQALGSRADRERAALRSVSASAPLFGFWGSGEIGPPDSRSPARGVGASVAVCVLRDNR